MSQVIEEMQYLFLSIKINYSLPPFFVENKDVHEI